MPELLNLTRRQILVRQIDSAIWLLQVRNEPIVANLIANAAIDVLRSLAKQAGVKTFKGTLEAYIKPERLKEWRDLDRAAYNHSKHADKDPEANLEEFHPMIAAFNVLAAVIDFGEVFKKSTPFMLVFRTCQIASHPELILDGPFREYHESFGKSVVGSDSANDLSSTCTKMLEAIDTDPSLIKGWSQQYLELR